MLTIIVSTYSFSSVPGILVTGFQLSSGRVETGSAITAINVAGECSNGFSRGVGAQAALSIISKSVSLRTTKCLG
ncbi:hypothetical protein GCM10009069_06100 [Algimonas arctica]|uniref:Uncharacterized protein n=1 Tax=Algimonas arctica TaxID=1479486 RepID=A0A8J3CQF3_9PROT|nr:hypothetical protein GCM10009069_06100 [Algimonas arctica]